MSVIWMLIHGEAIIRNTFIYRGHPVQSANFIRHNTVLSFHYGNKVIPPAQPGLSLFMQRPSSGLLMAPTASDDTISPRSERPRCRWAKAGAAQWHRDPLILR
jgi:hypothetical protein